MFITSKNLSLFIAVLLLFFTSCVGYATDSIYDESEDYILDEVQVSLHKQKDAAEIILDLEAKLTKRDQYLAIEPWYKYAEQLCNYGTKICVTASGICSFISASDVIADKHKNRALTAVGVIAIIGGLFSQGLTYVHHKRDEIATFNIILVKEFKQLEQYLEEKN